MSHKIISIGRQFGSGGHQIGLKTAEALGVHCYDKELITLAALRGKMDPDWTSDFDEQPPNPWLYEAAYNANDALPAGESVSAVLFNLQSQVIRAIAGQEDAVIMGRCADHVLRGEQDVRLLSVFIAAPFPDRVERKMGLLRISRRKAEKLVRQTDERRAKYYRTYTVMEWGRKDGYDLYFDSSIQSEEEIVEGILDAWGRLEASGPDGGR